MSLVYLGSDPGLVRQGNDRKSTDAQSGRVELIREYRCRTSYVPLARTILVPGAALEENADLTLEAPPDETEELGFTLFTCRYVGVDSSAITLRDIPLIKSTSYTVLTLVEDEIAYNVRIGYPSYAYQFTYSRGQRPTRPQPLISFSDFTYAMIGMGDATGESDQWLWAILSPTADETQEFSATSEWKYTLSWLPVAFPANENLPGATLLQNGLYRYIWQLTQL